MVFGSDSLKWVIILSSILHRVLSNPAASTCELSVTDNNELYNFHLASPIPKFPRGVLSEDGFYKVAVNKTVVWFQLCDGMVFNHEPPMCVECSDCRGPSRCGMGCSALMANNIGGYDICTSIGRISSFNIDILDKKNPHNGVVIKMSSPGIKVNCSLSVSVICDMHGLQGPHSLEKLGACDYATVLRHPSGCAKVVRNYGNGLGWFSTLLIVICCLLGGYLLAGIVYRHFFLGVRGIDVVPNLNFWASLPRRTQSSIASLVRKYKGPSQGHRISYSPVNF